MNWYKAEDGTLIDLDLVRYIYKKENKDTYLAVLDLINLNEPVIDGNCVEFSKNDYKNIEKILLNK